MVTLVMPKRPRTDEPRPYRALGQRLALARQRAGYTQRAAAKQLQVSEGYIPLIEGGKRRADPAILQRMARLYEIRYEELAELVGFLRPTTGDIAIMVTPDEAEEVAAFRELPWWARQIGLAAGRAARSLSPIQHIEPPNQPPGGDGAGSESNGEPDA